MPMNPTPTRSELAWRGSLMRPRRRADDARHLFARDELRGAGSVDPDVVDPPTMRGCRESRRPDSNRRPLHYEGLRGGSSSRVVIAEVPANRHGLQIGMTRTYTVRSGYGTPRDPIRSTARAGTRGRRASDHPPAALGGRRWSRARLATRAMPAARRLPRPRRRRRPRRAAGGRPTPRGRRARRAPRNRSAGEGNAEGVPVLVAYADACFVIACTRRAVSAVSGSAATAHAAPVARTRSAPRSRRRVYIAPRVQVRVCSGGLTLLLVGARWAYGSGRWPGCVGAFRELHGTRDVLGLAATRVCGTAERPGTGSAARADAG